MKYLKYFDNYTMEEVNHRILYNIIDQGDFEAFKKFLNQTDNAENYLDENIVSEIVKNYHLELLNYLLDNNYEFPFNSLDPIFVKQKLISKGYLQLVKKMSEKGVFNPNTIQIIELENKNILERHNNYPLESLDGIEIFKYLDKLIAVGCGLKDLNNFKELYYLKFLILSGNYINDDGLKPLQYLKNLKTLNLGGNEISSLKYISHLTNLVDLKLQNNNIDTIDGIENLNNLKTLNLENNMITSINEFENYDNRFMTYLILSDNPIIDFTPLQYLKKLETLECISPEAGVDDFEFFENLIHLEELEISYNGAYVDDDDTELVGIEDLKSLRYLKIYVIEIEKEFIFVEDEVRELQEKIKE